MRKLLKVSLITIIIAMLLLTAGCGSVTPAALPEHTIMKTSITLPADASNLLVAYLKAAEVAANQVIDNYLLKTPAYISFNFTTNVALSQEERDKMMELFESYNVTVDDRGLNPPKRTLEERAEGITIGFPSTTQYQTSDCDLTIPVDIYFGTRCYTYACDYDIVKNEYVLFRWEKVYDQKVVW